MVETDADRIAGFAKPAELELEPVHVESLYRQVAQAVSRAGSAKILGGDLSVVSVITLA